MKKLYFALAAFLMLLGMSCSRQEQDVKLPCDEIGGEQMTFKASFGDVEDTRTVFISDEAASSWPVYWTPGDAINIFYGEKSGARFETSEEFTTAGPSAEFVGFLQAATGTSDDSGGTTTQNFWAVYPFDENNTCDGSSVILTIPSEQTGVAGSFANKLNPTVAMSPNLGLSFYNVASWFIFTLTQENVVQATLEGANGETLVGKVKVSMDSNNRPHIDEVTEGKTLITMTPDGESFQTGEFYCMVILPGTYNNGLILTLMKEDGSKAKCEIKRQDGNPMVIERSRWARKKKADEGLTYNLDLPSNNEIWYTSLGNVVVEPYFQCDWVKMDKIESNTMIDGVGKIVFKNDITEIPFQAFFQNLYYGPLQTIILPNSVKKISYKAFYGCSLLETIRIPDGLTTIDDYAFYKCRRLNSILLPETLTSLGVDVFTDCDELRTLTLNTSASFHPDGLAYLLRGSTIETIQGPYATEDGKYAIIDGALTMAAGYNMSNAVIPEGVTSIQPFVFCNDRSIKTVVIPESVNSINSCAFYGCSSLDYITLKCTTPPTGVAGNTWISNTFDETNECPIIVPVESVDAYKQAWPQYSHRIGGSLEDVPTNLSKNGRANCYIVNSAGQYRFNATTKGNSSEAVDLYQNGAPSYAEILWESVIMPPSFVFSHEPGTLISEIRFENGQILFTATGNEGNALVAVKNSSGQILWSWHLWFVNEEINEIDSSLMDRNLGAIRSDSHTTAYDDRRSLTYGLLYQQGRKDPFVGQDQDLWDFEITTAQYPDRTPTTVFGALDGTWSTSSKIWYTDKQSNDPCPPGWRIPSTSHFSGDWSFIYEGNYYPASQASNFCGVDDYYYQGHLFPCGGMLEMKAYAGNGNNPDYRIRYTLFEEHDEGEQVYGNYYLVDGIIELRSGYEYDFYLSIKPYSRSSDYRAFSIRCCRDN